MPTAVRSLKQEQRQLTAELRAQHKTWAEVATILRDRYDLNMRTALRVARGWSQRQAADAWNQRWPADTKSFKNFSYWENWPAPTGHSPSLEVLTRLAELYECRVADLLLDCGDFRSQDPEHRDNQLPDLALDSLVATGTWREQTSPDGYYKGAIYHGSLQLLVEPSRHTMRGMWLGFGRDFRVNTGHWTLTREETSTARTMQRAYHLKL